MKTLKKNLKKLLSLVLSVSMLIVFVPTSFPEVSALEEELFVNEDGYTYYDVMAGIISLEELYGPLSEDSVPDAVGYENALAKGHLRRRYDLEEGLYHIVFENTDGSLSSYYFDYPVKRENADGEVKDVSLEIGPVEALGGLYAGQQSEVSTAFGLTSNEGILLQNDEVEIKLVPVLPVADPETITPGMTAIGNIATSNITAIDNKTVSYEYDDSTTIEYSLTYTGFKEDIVVEEYTGQTEYYFILETNGLKLEKENGSYFLSENQEVKATLGDIIIFTADERNNSLGYMSHSVIKENEKYIITIHVDEAWLRDEDTAYPIRIDPTVEVANVSGAIEDVTINSNAGSSATSSTIFAGKRDSYGISRILMKFPGLDYENFANSEAITNAYVELRDLMCESEQLQINCFAFGYDWDEDTVSWSDFDPALHGSYLTNRTIHYANGVNQPTPHRYAFTITRAVKEWRAGTRSPDRGLLFKAANETELIHKTFASFNRSSYKPTLVVVYNNELSPVVWDGEYYINNKHYGKYLAYEPNRFFNASGMMEDLGDSIKWEVVKVTNGYVIRSVDDTTKYLSVVANTASSGMEVVTHTSGTLPERCIWDFIPTTGGRLIKNVATGKYLYCSASGIYASTNLFAANTASYNTAVWRNADVDYYTDRELQSFSVNDMVMSIGETKTLIINYKSPTNALWGTAENYNFELSNTTEYTGSVTISGANITGTTFGLARIKATHKATGISNYFIADVCKKAIIVLPGIMGSAMYAKSDFTLTHTITHTFEQNDKMWDPPTDGIWEIVDLNACVRSLSLDDSGASVYPVGVGSPIVNNNKEAYRVYGAQDIYENVYLELYQTFSASYDVILYEYDWRYDPYDTALELKEYIEDNHYNDVVFVSHSMGGNVSSYYLSLCADARERVDKHISVGTPYLGAEKLAYAYDTGDALDVPFGIWDSADWLKTAIKEIMPNMPAIYSLLPIETHFTPYLQIKSSTGQITTQSTYSSTVNMLSTHLNDWNTAFYNSVKSHQSSLFVYGQHVTRLVDSYYIVGGGETTPNMIQISLNASNQKSGDLTLSGSTMSGDGTVTLHSALINGTVTENILYIHTEDGVLAEHVELIKGNSDENVKIFDYICDVISGVDVYSYNDSEFFNNYSGYKEVL